MITAAHLALVNGGNGGYTSDKCVDTLIRLFNNIPEPDTLKRLKKPIENIFDKGNYKKSTYHFWIPIFKTNIRRIFFQNGFFLFSVK
jgi:hypothetical protein